MGRWRRSRVALPSRRSDGASALVSVAVAARLAFGLSSALPLAHAWDYGKEGTDWNEGSCQGGPAASGQSPIDLPQLAESTSVREIFLKYPSMRKSVGLYNNGHSLAITVPEDYRAGFGVAALAEALTHETSTEAAFRLWQMNFHAPSEHTLAGVRAPLEVQLVHQQVTGNRTGQLAVVSVLFYEDQDTYDPFLERVLAGGLPQKLWDEVQVHFGDEVMALTNATNGFLPAAQVEHSKKSELQQLLVGSAYYVYEGSLTVPPCEPEVRYFVRQQHVPAAQAQLLPITNLLKSTCPPSGNSRAIPTYTTAASALGLATAVDWFQRSQEEARATSPDLPSWEDAESAPQAQLDNFRRTYLDATRSQFNEIQATDSAEEREVKTAYNRAKFDYMVASQERSKAQQNLFKAKEAFESAKGAVAALHAKWEVVICEENVEKAAMRLSEKQTALNRATEQALARMPESTTGQHPLEQGADRTTPLPYHVAMNVGFEFGAGITTSQATTTITPDAAGYIWRNKPAELTHVRGGLSLPVGLAASPFMPETPSTKSYVGTGRGSTAIGLSGIKLTPDLRPDLPQGQVPIPSGTTAAPPPPEAVPPMQIVLKLPIRPDSVHNDTQLKEDLLQALAEDLHLSRGRLDIPEVRGNQLSELDLQRSPGVPGLLQRPRPGSMLRAGLVRWGHAA